ncbi:MAG: cytochrome c biogenesis protein CcmE [Rhodobacteraceae bacterium PARR1]|nr:MAG: cytochrome c biogenesis protein CcmE [Rhodobacteraceae bacterium PARR1]
MKNLKKRRRVQLIAFLAGMLTVGTFGIWMVMPADAINFFRSPTEVVTKPPAQGEVFRIGGLVEKGSIIRGQGETITFKVTDTKTEIPISYTGVLPDLFSEGTGMVATGVMDNGVFVASEILAKHDETYKPKEVVDALKAQGIDITDVEHSN